jgi:uncharacterized membrane protein
MSKAAQIGLAVVILAGLVYFYWYSRNYVAGYYEVAWYAGGRIWGDVYTKAMFAVAVLGMVGYAVYYKIKFGRIEK